MICVFLLCSIYFKLYPVIDLDNFPFVLRDTRRKKQSLRKKKMVFFCERELPRAETDSFLFAWTRVVGLDKGRSLRDDNISRCPISRCYRQSARHTYFNSMQICKYDLSAWDSAIAIYRSHIRIKPVMTHIKFSHAFRTILNFPLLYDASACSCRWH